MTIAAVIVAAGRGTRAATHASGLPKQYAIVGGKPLLAHTIQAIAGRPEIDRILVVIHPDDRALYDDCLPDDASRLLAPVLGGAERQASVRAGLEALAGDPPDLVLVHDAARPFVDSRLVARVIDAARTARAALPGIPVADTLKRTGADNRVLETVPREHLWRAQTPQGFHYAALLAAHRAAVAAGRTDFTDDAALVQWHGLDVVLVAGDAANIKVTTPEDLVMAQRQLTPHVLPDVRTGQGFDVHRFCAGDRVWLCGVEIAHSHALEGHSDADVGLHALTDALLGAIGDGDIGQHFPPSDPQWKGAASHIFLADAARRVRERGGVITNVDVTILCEAPRIGPHRPAMQAAIAHVLGIGADRVGVKATTTEGLGFTGRREGIAAMATATVVLPAA